MGKTVAIMTGYGGPLGTGHIQRAVSIAWYLNSLPDVQSFIWAMRPPGLFHDEIDHLFIQPGSGNPDIIVRDMRDSTVEEIRGLQHVAKVLALDDIGEGRNAADWCVDLLPNPVSWISNDYEFQKSHFVYGYNFLSAIRARQGIDINKTIDVLFYGGADPDPRYVEKILQSMPAAAVCAVAGGENSFIIKNGIRQEMNVSSYGDLLLASKSAVTHFGILVYEALLTGAEVITINPTEYHSSLADLIAEKWGIINLGTASSFDESLFKTLLEKIMNSHSEAKADPATMISHAMDNLHRFSKHILSLGK